MPRERLSPAEARRLAVAAQGLHRAPPKGPVDHRDVAKAVRRLGIVQIDSVNVLARAHALTLHARLGAHEPDAMHRAAYGGRRRTLFEYWAHECSLVPVESHRLWRWRMEDARAGIGIYGGLARFAEEKHALIDATLRAIEREGPMAAGDFEGQRGKGSWWGWSEGKHALEWLFWAGLVTTATRRGNFERVYDLPERALPRAAVEAPTPSREEAQRGLLAQALRAHGVATESDLRDHARLKPAEARARLAELAEEGAALPVRVKGWSEAWLDPTARVPRRCEGRALLCPFDSLVWSRPRTERLFGMRLKLEIYTPAENRVYGYYVLPFLVGDRLAARVDLKADRQAGTLVARASHLDDGAADETAERLAPALRDMARWLGLAEVRTEPRGDLAPELARALGG